MRSKRLLSLMMALAMLLTLTAPTLAWATEGEDGGEDPVDSAVADGVPEDAADATEAPEVDPIPEPEPEPAAYRLTFQVEPATATVKVYVKLEPTQEQPEPDYSIARAIADLSALEPGVYHYIVTAEGYLSAEGDVTISDKDVTRTIVLVAVAPDPEPDPEPVADPEPDPDPVVDPEPVSDPEPDPEPVADPEPDPEPVSDPEPDPEPVADPEPDPDPVADPEPDPEPVSDSEPDPAPVADPEPETEPDPVPEPDPEPAADPEPDPESVADPEPDPEPVADPEPDPEPVADPEPAADPEPDPEPVADPVADPEPDPEPVVTEPMLIGTREVALARIDDSSVFPDEPYEIPFYWVVTGEIGDTNTSITAHNPYNVPAHLTFPDASDVGDYSITLWSDKIEELSDYPQYYDGLAVNVGYDRDNSLEENGGTYDGLDLYVAGYRWNATEKRLHTLAGERLTGSFTWALKDSLDNTLETGETQVFVQLPGYVDVGDDQHFAASTGDWTYYSPGFEVTATVTPDLGYVWADEPNFAVLDGNGNALDVTIEPTENEDEYALTFPMPAGNAFIQAETKYVGDYRIELHDPGYDVLFYPGESGMGEEYTSLADTIVLEKDAQGKYTGSYHFNVSDGVNSYENYWLYVLIDGEPYTEDGTRGHFAYKHFPIADSANMRLREYPGWNEEDDTYNLERYMSLLISHSGTYTFTIDPGTKVLTISYVYDDPSAEPYAYMFGFLQESSQAYVLGDVLEAITAKENGAPIEIDLPIRAEVPVIDGEEPVWAYFELGEEYPELFVCYDGAAYGSDEQINEVPAEGVTVTMQATKSDLRFYTPYIPQGDYGVAIVTYDFYYYINSHKLVIQRRHIEVSAFVEVDDGETGDVLIEHSDDIAITMAPEGPYYSGDEITLTAPFVPGMKFDGWYLPEYVYDDDTGEREIDSWSQECEAYTFIYHPTASIQIKAVYDTMDALPVADAFADPAFQAYVSAEIDTDHDGVLSGEEIGAVKVIDLSGEYQDGASYAASVASLSGVENFPLLEELYSDPFFSVDGHLTEVDLSHNTKLRVVDLGFNPLTAVDVSMLPDLESLMLGFTNIAEIDLSHNPKLQALWVDDSPISTLDIRNNPELAQLDVCHTNLTEIDISGCSSLLADYEAGPRDIDLPYLEGLLVYGGEGEGYNLAIPEGLTVITGSSEPTSGACGDDLTWSFDESAGELTITGSGLMYDFGDEMVPWAAWREAIMSVSLPDGLTSIGASAFSDCAYLTSIDIPYGVTSIGGKAFYCSGLTSVTIPDSVTEIGAYAFMGCGLTSVTIPESVEWIGEGAFAYSKLMSLTILGSTHLDMEAFFYCTELRSVTFPCGASNGGVSTFEGCCSIEEIHLTEGTGTMEFTFSEMLSYAYTAWSEEGEPVFVTPPALTVIVDEGVETISEGGFGAAVTYLTLPVSVTTIENDAFPMGLETVTYGGTEAQRAAISIDEGNDGLENATWHYVELLTGWQEQDGNRYYYNDDGTKATGWKKIDAKWYYFNTDGVMQTGWQTISGKKYYLGTDGVMKTGWVKVDNKWYYLNTSGAMLTGWQTISGKKYYLGTDGVMQTGWVKVDNKWYYLNTSGAMLTGWQTISGKKYYLGTDGVMKTGWVKVDNKWYYLNSSGAMLTGWQTISGKKYYLGTDGIMKTGWVKVDNKWYYLNTSGAMLTGLQTIDTKKYYLGTDGVMATGWQKIDAKWYYFNTSGIMLTGWQTISGKKYYLGTDGVMTTGWQKIDAKWYYFNTSGVMQTGWQKISNKWYYFDDDGAMVTGWLKLSNKWYYFETSGVMLANTTKTIGKKAYTFNASGVCTNP